MSFGKSFSELKKQKVDNFECVFYAHPVAQMQVLNYGLCWLFLKCLCGADFQGTRQILREFSSPSITTQIFTAYDKHIPTISVVEQLPRHPRPFIEKKF